jgi:hypothetical protein
MSYLDEQLEIKESAAAKITEHRDVKKAEETV